MGVLSLFPANPKGQQRFPHLLQEGLTSELCAPFCSPPGGSGGQGPGQGWAGQGQMCAHLRLSKALPPPPLEA